ncbi:MAG: PQQ-binding-like beta-propeller repeat protein [Planctomycetota bacterium]|nr:PQQ-binding-like beta-propeller repeat protein [Planctomycetota bacterium]
MRSMFQYCVRSGLTWCLVRLLHFPVSAQENWPEFRGPTADGHASGHPLPTDLDRAGRLRWKTPIHGKGWSSPVVWGKQVWLTTATEDGKRMSVLCIDLESGAILRDQVMHENDSPEFCHPTNSYASPTPAIEEGRVYVHFGSYGTTCLDTVTGDVIWQRTDLKCDHFRGPGSSPILYDDKLFVAFDGADVQYVVALDKQTGETVWRTDRDIDYGTTNGDLKKAYGTGRVFEVDGEPLLIYPSAVATNAYDVKTGKQRWKVYHDGMNASARPLMTPGGLLILTNGMGKMVAVNPSGQGDITDTHTVWMISKGVTRKPSQLIVGDRLFMISDKGIASAIDVTTGEIIWQERIGGAFSSSPIYDGEKILACSESGDIHMIRPGDTFQPLAKVKIGEGFKASPAVVNGQLILRGFSELYCFSAED